MFKVKRDDIDDDVIIHLNNTTTEKMSHIDNLDIEIDKIQNINSNKVDKNVLHTRLIQKHTKIL